MLTVLVHRKLEKLAFVRWFMNERGAGNFASGPIIEKTTSEWRIDGWNFVKQHFSSYNLMRVPRSEMIPVFAPNEGPKFLKNYRPIEIQEYPIEVLHVIPMDFKRHSLGELQRLDGGEERIVLSNQSNEEFHRAFETVLKQVE